ncbi:MAG: hypothetical protein HFI50_16925 [Lachnospiraceae bacterium]|jgi:hypothetical protein|nr:hypothetical protein [Lachnospiraceae bacterium]
MKNEGWEKQQVRRASYRAALRSDAGEAQNDRAFAECQRILEQEKEAHRLLAASLYRYGRFLFLYTEGIGETAVPEKLFAPAVPLLQKWPVTIEEPDNDRVWVLMQPYYYHAIPESAEEWMRNRQPSQRRGRIALLAPGKWENYMMHHLALMREGLIEGDRYHLISIHENVLFSYFEEPKTMTNLQRKPGAQSKALEDWLLTDPESHFMRFVPGQGPGPDENFMFLSWVAGV